MADLALEILYDAVVARFVADAAAEDPPGTAPAQPFGWREPAKRDAAPRITWVPGDDENGELGAFDSARNPGRNPRPLATLRELATVYIEAADTTAPESEIAQYRAARMLYDAWLRAVYLAAHGTFSLRSHRWVNERATRRFGAAIRVVIEVESMVPDKAFSSMPTDAVAATAFELDDTTDGARDFIPDPLPLPLP